MPVKLTSSLLRDGRINGCRNWPHGSAAYVAIFRDSSTGKIVLQVTPWHSVSGTMQNVSETRLTH